jgi:hypothetical protein
VENGEVDKASHGGGVSLLIACKHGMDDDVQFPAGSTWLPLAAHCGSVMLPRLPRGWCIVSSEMGTEAPGALTI